MKIMNRSPRLALCLLLWLSLLLPACKQETVCNNDCLWANDGQCDDGGDGSDTSLCGEGSDCDDCGPRLVRRW